MNLGSRGSSFTLGLPGSGLSYRVPLSAPKAKRDEGFRPVPVPQPSYSPRPLELTPAEPGYVREAGDISSRPVGTLTSASLADLKRLIIEARQQRVRLKQELKLAIRHRDAAYRWHWLHSYSPFRLMSSARLKAAKAKLSYRQEYVDEVANALSSCFMRLSFQMPPRLAQAWQSLVAAHNGLNSSQKIWDITSEVAVDRFQTRSAASSSLNRKPVDLGRARIESDVIVTRESALRFGNANGVSLNFYPGLCMMQGRADFDLVSMLDIEVQFAATRFIESESIPSDSKVVDYAWLKTNKDGSRDKRFVNNRQLPIALYGSLAIGSPTGINEAYMFSNVEWAGRFALAYQEMKDAQRAQGALQADDSGIPDQSDVDEAFAVTVPEPVLAPAWFLMTAVTLVVIGGVFAYSQLTPALNSPEPTTFALSATPAQDHLPLSPPRPPLAEAPSAPTALSSGTPSAQPPKTAPVSTPSILISKAQLSGTTVTAKQAANIRAAGEGTARVVRTANPGEKFAVFGRANGWIQIGPIGSEKPVGWIAATLVTID